MVKQILLSNIFMGRKMHIHSVTPEQSNNIVFGHNLWPINNRSLATNDLKISKS